MLKTPCLTFSLFFGHVFPLLSHVVYRVLSAKVVQLFTKPRSISNFSIQNPPAVHASCLCNIHLIEYIDNDSLRRKLTNITLQNSIFHSLFQVNAQNAWILGWSSSLVKTELNHLASEDACYSPSKIDAYFWAHGLRNQSLFIDWVCVCVCVCVCWGGIYGGIKRFSAETEEGQSSHTEFKGGGDGRILTANEGCSLEYYRTSCAYRVDLILTRPKSSEPPPPFGDK